MIRCPRGVILVGAALLFTQLVPSGAILPAIAQTNESTADVRVPAGPGYATNSVKQLLMGSGYRDLWATPIRLPTVRLDTLEGGLTPLRTGGGRTTATLHVRSADGRRFVFRTVDKDPLTGQLEELAGTIFGSSVKDQISAFHPAGALVVPRLAEAVGVHHVKPRLVVLEEGSDVPELAERFLGRVLWFEERPDRDAGFAGSNRVLSTADLLDSLRISHRHRVDAPQFLRARLLDLLVGDRDRAIDNWRWVGREDGEGWRYEPVPRDRDQAFIELNGLIKTIARPWYPRLVSFGSGRIDVVGLSRNAWDLDRRVLPAIDRRTWDSIAMDVKSRLTDEVIDQAAAALPAEYPAERVRQLAEALRMRREALLDAAADFYALVSGQADVWGTESPDSLHVRTVDRQTYLWLGRAGDAPRATLERTFESHETEEIRVYLAGGDDVAVFEGSGSGTPTLRVVGGAGRDSFVDRTTSEGRGLNVYDADAGSRLALGRSARHVARSPRSPIAWGDSATARTWGGRTVPLGTAQFNGDFGLILAAGLRSERFRFDRDPFGSRTHVMAGYAFGHGRGFGQVERRIRRAGASRREVRVRARYSGVERLRFYGFGNDSEASEPEAFYRIPHDEAQLAIELRGELADNVSLRFGPILKLTWTDTTGATSFLAQSHPYGSGSFSQLGAEATLVGCTRPVNRPGPVWGRPRLCKNATFDPHASVVATASYHWPLQEDALGGFGSIDLRLAGSWPVHPRLVLASRIGGRATFGDSPFFAHAYVGGTRSVRGFAFDRYVGEHSVIVSSEVRWALASFRTAWFPLDIGLIGLVDTGRVWYASDSPGGWHRAWGGGLWLAPLKDVFTVHAVVARGPDRTTLHIGPAFSF